MVSIVGPLKNFIVRACSVPTMKCGHRSGHDVIWESPAFAATHRSWMDPVSCCKDQWFTITSGVWASRLFNARLLQSSGVSYLEVRDLPPRVLLFWTTEIHFGSSGFRNFQCTTLTILKVSYFRSVRSASTSSIEIHFERFFLLLSHAILHFQSVRSPPRVSSAFNGSDLLWDFGTSGRLDGNLPK
jgi:hypothetical protein